MPVQTTIYYEPHYFRFETKIDLGVKMFNTARKATKSEIMNFAKSIGLSISPKYTKDQMILKIADHEGINKKAVIKMCKGC